MKPYLALTWDMAVSIRESSNQRLWWREARIVTESPPMQPKGGLPLYVAAFFVRVWSNQNSAPKVYAPKGTVVFRMMGSSADPIYGAPLDPREPILYDIEAAKVKTDAAYLRVKLDAETPDQYRRQFPHDNLPLWRKARKKQ